MGQTHPAVCICIACELRMVFIFLMIVKKKNKHQTPYITYKMLKICTGWLLPENVQVFGSTSCPSVRDNQQLALSRCSTLGTRVRLAFLFSENGFPSDPMVVFPIQSAQLRLLHPCKICGRYCCFQSLFRRGTLGAGFPKY